MVSTIALTLLGIACAAPSLTHEQATTWLDARAGASRLDVDGAWESTASFVAGGWGDANWIQKGSRVDGTLGLYQVQGRVNGQKLYLVILSNGRVYYTAILEPAKGGGLRGAAVAAALADAPEAAQKEHAPIALVRKRTS
jgi:hypothetical protein